MNGKKIGFLGWAFKANTNDSRESAAIYVAEKLYNSGAALDIYDPMVSDDSIFRDVEFYWKVQPFVKNQTRIRGIQAQEAEVKAYT